MISSEVDSFKFWEETLSVQEVLCFSVSLQTGTSYEYSSELKGESDFASFEFSFNYSSYTVWKVKYRRTNNHILWKIQIEVINQVQKDWRWFPVIQSVQMATQPPFFVVNNVLKTSWKIYFTSTLLYYVYVSSA